MSDAEEKIKKANYYEQIEEEINKRAEQMAQQKINSWQKQAKKMQYASTPMELGQWSCDPDAKDEYPDLSKDEFLGNLDAVEYRKIVQDDELLGLLMDNPDIFGELLPVCIRRRKSSLAVSNSKLGFARRQLTEESVNVRKYSSEGSESSGMLKGAFKRRR